MEKAKTLFKVILIQAVWWAAWITFCIVFLRLAFRFDVLSARHWHLAATYGFGGLRGTALLISISAALPIGAAMATLFYKWKGFQKPKKAEVKAPAEHEAKEDPAPKIEIKKDLPDELKNAYIKIKQRAESIPPVVEEEKKTEEKENKTEPTEILKQKETIKEAPKKFTADAPAPAKATKTESDDLFEMDDFDPTPKSAPQKDSAPSFAPMEFKPMTFGGDNKENDKEEDVEDDGIELIETDKEIRVIAEHKDEGAWIAEEEEMGGRPPQWFKEGAQKTSPVYLAKKKAETVRSDKKIITVLKITDGSIINKKAMMPVWEKMGVTVEE
ncbi:MAG: hypothetical protein FWD33_03375 [Alphaproteobacteria bacterium]|nr:hypothetical protein [Alphaproteobacteria bacterium]